MAANREGMAVGAGGLDVPSCLHSGSWMRGEVGLMVCSRVHFREDPPTKYSTAFPNSTRGDKHALNTGAYRDISYLEHDRGQG